MTENESTQTDQEQKPAPTDSSDMPGFQMAALGLSGTGFALSLVLEQLHVQTHTVPNADHFCTVGTTFDCATVAASPYALFLGLPWAIWGALGFIALGIASYQRSKWLLPLSGIAAAISALLFVLSVTVIGSVCLMCEAVHITSIVLFVVAYRARSHLKGDLKDWAAGGSIIALPTTLSVALYLVVPSYWGSFSYKSDPPFPTGKTAEGHYWIGSEDPTVTIHEYVNYRCPFCKIGTARMLRELGSRDDWRIVRRPLPPGGCPEGTKNTCHSARMAYCAGEQGEFWRADRWLFAHARAEKRFSKDALVTDLRLDGESFEACYTSEAAYKYNDESYNQARAKGLKGVPSYEIESKGPIPEELKPLQQSAKEKK